MTAPPPILSSTPTDLLAAFFDASQPREYFDDSTIEQIALLLARSEHCAQKEPRTYIVLRFIGRLDVVEELLKAGFGDGWFPVEARSLPGFLDPNTRADIVKHQRLVLTKAVHLEHGRHCHFGPEEPLPFTTLSRLGSGSFGQVTKIESTVTFRQYALKTILRRAAFGEQSKRTMKDILSEMRIMQSLQHEHIVRYIGSYTNKNSFGILMSPIAEQDLAAYLQQATPIMHPTIRTFFGCLARALSFLHENKIRHRDIKPQNILIHGSKALLTDFGLSRDYVDTTSGPAHASPRYRAPEVAAGEGRNTSADIWALGCVFLEMLAALRGYNIDWLRKYYLSNGDGITTNFHANLCTNEKLLNEWAIEPEAIDKPAMVWTKRMLEPRRNDRASAAEIAKEITATIDRISFKYSCSSCCDSETDSDSILSLLEETYDTLTREPSKAEQIPRKPLPQYVTGTLNSTPPRYRPNSYHDKAGGVPSAAFDKNTSQAREVTNFGPFNKNAAEMNVELFDDEHLPQIQPPDTVAGPPSNVAPFSTEAVRIEPSRTRLSDTAVFSNQQSQSELSSAESGSTVPSNTGLQSTELSDTASSVTEPFFIERPNDEWSNTTLSYINTWNSKSPSTRSSTPETTNIESLPRLHTKSLYNDPPNSESLQTGSLRFEPPDFKRIGLPYSELLPLTSTPPHSVLPKPQMVIEDESVHLDSSKTTILKPGMLLNKHEQTTYPPSTNEHHAMVTADRSKEVTMPQKLSSRATRNAGYDTSHIPFYIDDKLICIPGKVPLIFGRCIEFILQAESEYMYCIAHFPPSVLMFSW